MFQCPCQGRISTLKTPSCPWHWVPGRSKFETGQLFHHYMAEILLNVMLTCNQPTNPKNYMKFLYAFTVNMVIFTGGKFCKIIGKIFHKGVIFRILLQFPWQSHLSLFSHGEIFTKISQKTQKLPPLRNFN